jgi:glycosyltransferase involved in cell wall biosynthesis
MPAIARDGRPREIGLVSAVIPAYNAALYLAATIASALDQTHPHVEVIVVDDGSTDDTPRIARGFSGPVIYVSQKNAGQSAARNLGISVSRGEFIAFLDADDLWEPTKCTRQLEAFRRRAEYSLVHTGRTVIDEHDRVLRSMDVPPPPEDGLVDLLKRNVITTSSVMVRADRLEDTPFADGIQGCEDWDLWLRLADAGPLGYVSEPLTRYRVHSSNISKRMPLMLRSMIGTLNRFLERDRDEARRLVAREHRHTLQLALAHTEFEIGNLPEARKWFQAAGRPMTRADRRRYLLCTLPAWLSRRLMTAYRTLRAAA